MRRLCFQVPEKSNCRGISGQIQGKAKKGYEREDRAFKVERSDRTKAEQNERNTE